MKRGENGETNQQARPTRSTCPNIHLKSLALLAFSSFAPLTLFLDHSSLFPQASSPTPVSCLPLPSPLHRPPSPLFITPASPSSPCIPAIRRAIYVKVGSMCWVCLLGPSARCARVEAVCLCGLVLHVLVRAVRVQRLGAVVWEAGAGIA